MILLTPTPRMLGSLICPLCKIQCVFLYRLLIYGLYFGSLYVLCLSVDYISYLLFRVILPDYVYPNLHLLKVQNFLKTFQKSRQKMPGRIMYFPQASSRRSVSVYRYHRDINMLGLSQTDLSGNKHNSNNNIKPDSQLCTSVPDYHLASVAVAFGVLSWPSASICLIRFA